MFRKVLLALLVTAAASVIETPTASGAVVSPRNPYRSFNITGVNYASMQWERAHRSGRRAVHFDRWLFRRR
jgi:hypothetical protein